MFFLESNATASEEFQETVQWKLLKKLTKRSNKNERKLLGAHHACVRGLRLSRLRPVGRRVVSHQRATRRPVLKTNNCHLVTGRARVRILRLPFVCNSPNTRGISTKYIFKRRPSRSNRDFKIGYMDKVRSNVGNNAPTNTTNTTRDDSKRNRNSFVDRHKAVDLKEL